MTSRPPPSSVNGRYRLRGRIVGVGFDSGDRVVIGQWDDSPIGPFVDVMWAEPGGRRLLFADGQRSADFIRAVYRFDECRIGPISAARDPRTLSVTVADRAVAVSRGRSLPVFGPRPRWVTRYIEGPIASRLLRVDTYGVSPTGVHEWYQARRWAPLRSATATIDGVSLGAMAPVDPPCRFGFSEAPRRPSWTEVRPWLYDPDAHLATVVGE
ncbi:MAG: hypothetical protein ACR2QE_14465 [Acidimicrobiales bacterium]